MHRVRAAPFITALPCQAVGLCLNRGSLVSSDWTLPQFTLLYLMPVYPRQGQGRWACLEGCRWLPGLHQTQQQQLSLWHTCVCRA
jgi:hypothetical protein